jgi:hypothetical protein
MEGGGVMAMQVQEQKAPGGWAELAVFHNGELVGVITHPHTGAPWFYHPMQFRPTVRFRTRKAALQAVMADLGVETWTRRK